MTESGIRCLGWLFDLLGFEFDPERPDRVRSPPEESFSLIRFLGTGILVSDWAVLGR